MWQQVYVLRQAVFANTLGGLMLCVVYGAATLLDAYIRSTVRSTCGSSGAEALQYCIGNESIGYRLGCVDTTGLTPWLADGNRPALGVLCDRGVPSHVNAAGDRQHGGSRSSEGRGGNQYGAAEAGRPRHDNGIGVDRHAARSLRRQRCET